VKKGRFTEEQIAYALHLAETGTSVTAVIRKMGISEQTFCRWKKQYAGTNGGPVAGQGEVAGRDRCMALRFDRSSQRWSIAGRRKEPRFARRAAPQQRPPSAADRAM
jgi:transposase-like protein